MPGGHIEKCLYKPILDWVILVDFFSGIEGHNIY